VTATITVAPPFPLLYAALWAASVAAYARGLCHLAGFAVTRREELRAPLLGWGAAALGLTAATALSGEAWQAGVPLAVVSAWCAVLWRRERDNGKAGA
jgi:hypothetical protein